MSRTFTLFFIWLFCLKVTSGQDTKGEMAAYNIALGSLFAGVGAIINKKPDQKLGKVLLKGMSQGALGGYMVYQSKNLIGKIASRENTGYSWPAKITNSVGISIIENASLNRNFWEQININIGFNRFEIHTNNRFRIQYKILPISFITTGITFFTSKFEPRLSLENGEFIFSNDKVRATGLDGVAGATYGTVIILADDFRNNLGVLSHELIHVYQYYDFNAFNSIIHKPVSNIEFQSETLNKINKILYWDLQAPLLLGLYNLENIGREDYFDNFFENEAGFWSDRLFDFPVDQ